jgi:small subunit ribosomal protein S27e
MPGNFYRVRCPDCDGEQVIFGKAATTVSCAVCGTTLAEPTGGKATFHGEVIETVERRGTEA